MVSAEVRGVWPPTGLVCVDRVVTRTLLVAPAGAPSTAGLVSPGDLSSLPSLFCSAGQARRNRLEVGYVCGGTPRLMIVGAILVTFAPAATAASTTTLLATRGAPPAQQPPCSTCLGWRHGRAERRLAGAGLGSTVKASASAMPVGRRGPWEAASSVATVGNGGERPRGWRALRGSPDAGSRPRMLMLLLLTLITIGMRREEGAASAGVPSSLIAWG